MQLFYSLNTYIKITKEVAGLIKLQIKGGAANPSPPVGPALGSKGINIMEFCKQFNARTQDKAGKILPVIITYYADKSFDFVIKTPPVAIQLLEVAKVKSGSAEPNRKKVAELTWEQIRTIAQDKMVDLNCFTVEAAMRMVSPSAKNQSTYCFSYQVNHSIYKFSCKQNEYQNTAHTSQKSCL